MDKGTRIQERGWMDEIGGGRMRQKGANQDGGG